jgi:hypothetical protein
MTTKTTPSTIKTIPLIGVPNQRNVDGVVTLKTNGKDQRFVGIFPEIVANPLTKKMTVYAAKRSGFEVVQVPAAGSAAKAISYDGVVTVWGASNTVYYNTTSCGVLAGAPLAISKVELCGEMWYMITSVASGGWYVPASTVGTALTFTGDTTSGSATIATVSSTTGMYVGQLLTGTGIADGARIATIGAGSITMTINATATNTTVTITRTYLSKIIDADFVSAELVGQFVEMGGYLFILGGTSAATIRLYNMDLNSTQSLTPNNYITPDLRADISAQLVKYNRYIICFGTESMEFFFNAGNAAGSPLGRAESLVKEIGCRKQTSPANQSLTEINGMVAWLGDQLSSTADGVGTLTPGVWLLDGGDTPKKISGQTEDNILFSLKDQNLRIDSFIYNGGTYIRVAMIGAEPRVQLCYHVEAQWWFDPGFPDDLLIARNTCAVSATATNGKVLRLQNTDVLYQDDGAPYEMVIQTSRLNFGSNDRTVIDRLWFVGDKQSSGSTTVEISKDDYATFETIGTFDHTIMNPEINNCGSFIGGAAFRLRNSDNAPWRGEAIGIEYRKAY